MPPRSGTGKGAKTYDGLLARINDAVCPDGSSRARTPPLGRHGNGAAATSGNTRKFGKLTIAMANHVPSTVDPESLKRAAIVSSPQPIRSPLPQKHTFRDDSRPVVEMWTPDAVEDRENRFSAGDLTRNARSPSPPSPTPSKSGRGTRKFSLRPEPITKATQLQKESLSLDDATVPVSLMEDQLSEILKEVRDKRGDTREDAERELPSSLLY
ncbi:hypothetical protein HDU93_007772 [Gonapodya sp. JEL0774]|nr:hypothetical protein HDU93_007772 [Gonapodya sp. JEL0774]